MNIILGNSITSFVIASCLKYKNEEFLLYRNNSKVYIPNIMLLKYSSNNELELYKKIFGIDDISKYSVYIKVGYYYDNEIHDSISEKQRTMYLKKQNRINTSSSMSNSDNSFNALLLDRIYKDKISIFTYKDMSEYNESSIDTIYDTIDTNKLINGHCYYEYVVGNTYFDVKDYDYIYDCTETDVKRYTKACIEYTKYHECAMIVENYYDEPIIYKHKNRIILGRSATKTQMKQKDIIDYMIYGKGDIHEV